MKMRSGGASCAPHGTYLLTLFHSLSHFGINVMKMGIEAGPIRGMLDEYHLSISRELVSCIDDFSWSNGIYGMPLSFWKINSFMVDGKFSGNMKGRLNRPIKMRMSLMNARCCE